MERFHFRGAGRNVERKGANCEHTVQGRDAPAIARQGDRVRMRSARVSHQRDE